MNHKTKSNFTIAMKVEQSDSASNNSREIELKEEYSKLKKLILNSLDEKEKASLNNLIQPQTKESTSSLPIKNSVCFKALADFQGQQGELSFKKDDILEILERNEQWHLCCLNGKKGYVPCTYVKEIAISVNTASLSLEGQIYPLALNFLTRTEIAHPNYCGILAVKFCILEDTDENSILFKALFLNQITGVEFLEIYENHCFGIILVQNGVIKSVYALNQFTALDLFQNNKRDRPIPLTFLHEDKQPPQNAKLIPIDPHLYAEIAKNCVIHCKNNLTMNPQIPLNLAEFSEGLSNCQDSAEVPILIKGIATINVTDLRKFDALCVEPLDPRFMYHFSDTFQQMFNHATLCFAKIEKGEIKEIHIHQKWKQMIDLQKISKTTFLYSDESKILTNLSIQTLPCDDYINWAANILTT